MKKIYNIPVAKFINLSTEDSLLTLSTGDGGPNVSEEGGVNKGSELSNRRSVSEEIWGFEN